MSNPVLLNKKPDISAEAVEEWLRDHFSKPISGVRILQGGFWSAAFAFDCDGEPLVVRFNKDGSGFQADQTAYGFAAGKLPIPEVLETGTALELEYAISRQHFGRFLELISVPDADRLSDGFLAMLAGLRAVNAAGILSEKVEWQDPDSQLSWHGYLVRGFGEASQLLEYPGVARLHEAAESRFRSLLPLCPERRDLIHGDLLHQNVLVSENASELTAVFSWKCSAFGDFLYDIAWCTHWAPWHPGVAALDVFNKTLVAADLNEQDLMNAAERHHCYELQIAASHLGWYVHTRDEENLSRLAVHLTGILERGPVAIN